LFMETQIMDNINVQHLIQLAGIAQITLALGSISIPKLLNWHAELLKPSLLIKQMFWTYAVYILVINTSFGLVSVFASHDLSDGSNLATMLTGFIAVYWISRLSTQFLYLDRHAFPKGKLYTIGETLLVLVFITLSAVYAFAFIYNLNRP
jgi:hypothetical protein